MRCPWRKKRQKQRGDARGRSDIAVAGRAFAAVAAGGASPRVFQRATKRMPNERHLSRPHRPTPGAPFLLTSDLDVKWAESCWLAPASGRQIRQSAVAGFRSISAEVVNDDQLPQTFATAMRIDFLQQMLLPPLLEFSDAVHVYA